MMNNLLDYAKRMLRYDAETGVLAWAITTGGRVIAGHEAGAKTVQGYRQIFLNGKFYKSHRIAWLLTYGEWPTGHLDHINGDRADNRIQNLRSCSVQQNSFNRKRQSNQSGFKGVTKYPRGWRARIGHQGKQIHLGLFTTQEDAAKAYREAAARLAGDFARYE